MNGLYENGWSALPRSVFISPDDRLNAMARLVLMCLLAHRNDVTGLCNPSQHTIARECGISVRSVGDALRLLIDTAYIAVDDTIKGRTNAYVFVFEIPHPSTSALHADMGRVSQSSALSADKQQNNSIVVINNTTTCEQPVTRCSGNDLIFDCNLHNAEPAFISFATALLEGIPDAQKILDEFNFQVGEKKQQGTPIRNPQGYLTRLAKLATSGEFIPSGALEIAKKREQRTLKSRASQPTRPDVVVEEAPKPKKQSNSAAPAHAIEHTPTETGRAAIAQMLVNMGRRPRGAGFQSIAARLGAGNETP